ncbi:MAG: carboxypeptidase regulatory-like domain-containing protein [Candidatus Sulfotelmatobacter sp.]
MRASSVNFWKLFSLLLLVLAIPHFAGAQANRASVTGTVTDTSGAIVPGVEVTATNKGTNVASKTVSNQDGIYVIPNLFPGEYSVEFKRDGFEILRRPDVRLESTEVARIDAALKVGAITESVTVTTDAPVLDLEKPTIGTNMKGSVVTDLPLSIYGGGRSVESFAVAITPGYSVYSSPYGAVINGGQWFTKEYTVDGTSGTANIQGDSLETGPTMEAVEELQAQTSGLDAQSSVTGGGVIAFNLKSGTNRLHGSAFLYGHNELLDANTWTNDNLGTPKPQQRAWDYGFSLGGPIFKNKTFFFGAFERYQQIDFRLNSGSATVPTADFMNGNFSALLGGTLCKDSGGGTGLCSQNGGTPIAAQDTNGNPIIAQVGMIYDPNSASDPLCTMPPCQFAGNIIPSDRISPVAQKVNTFYQNYPAQFGGIDNNSRGLLQGSPSQTPNEIVIKLDHTLREQDHLSGSWIYNHRPRTLDDGGGLWQAGTTTGGPLSNGRYQIYRAQQWRLSESHTFSPRVLNVLNFTYNFDFNASSPTNPGTWNSQLGFGDTGANTFPLISFQDGQAGHSETFLGNTWQGDVSGVNITTGDSVTWTKGRHNFTFGGDFKAHQVNSRSGSGAFSFGFTYLTTAGAGYPYDGFGYASFLLGQVDNKASESVPYNLYGRQKGIDLFVQDSYKATPKLTLSMGLRWNYNFRFHEKNGNWANFDLNAIDPTYGIPGALVFAKNGDDSFEKNEYAKNFGPSFGFAYQLLPKTVLRGSFGLIYNPVGVTFFGGVPDTFAPQLGTNNTNNFSWDAPGGGGNYPGVLSVANASTDPTSLFPEVSVDPRALRLGYSEAFNFGIQQELTPNTRFELSYVGNRGHRLTDTSLAWNEGPTSTFLRLQKQGLGLGTYNDYICDPGTAAADGVPYPYPGFCGPILAAIAPFPQMAQSEVNYWGYANLLYVGLPLGQSFYDSMIANVVKRTGRGLTMDMSYTWSRQEGDSYSAEQEGNNYYTGVQDFSNMRQAAHAVTGYDLTHVVKGFVSYELPFGRGRTFLGNQDRVVNAIVGGWTLTGIVTYNSGQPFAVSAANPYWPLWGDIYPQFNLTGFAGPSNPKKFVPVPLGGTVPASNFYMPASVASNPPPGVLPPSPTTSALRCPGQANENASLLKNFTMGSDGQYRLSFRTEFYNLFNRHYYQINGCGGVRASVGASNFGQITGVADGPRQGQFAVRFDF